MELNLVRSRFARETVMPGVSWIFLVFCVCYWCSGSWGEMRLVIFDVFFCSCLILPKFCLVVCIASISLWSCPYNGSNNFTGVLFVGETSPRGRQNGLRRQTAEKTAQEAQLKQPGFPGREVGLKPTTKQSRLLKNSVCSMALFFWVFCSIYVLSICFLSIVKGIFVASGLVSSNTMFMRLSEVLCVSCVEHPLIGHECQIIKMLLRHIGIIHTSTTRAPSNLLAIKWKFKQDLDNPPKNIQTQ